MYLANQAAWDAELPAEERRPPGRPQGGDGRPRGRDGRRSASASRERGGRGGAKAVRQAATTEPLPRRGRRTQHRRGQWSGPARAQATTAPAPARIGGAARPAWVANGRRPVAGRRRTCQA